ncbi:fibronectin type III domain-containing protein [Runella zeae]|uniref:fibronectin type III domain-containing protein n=1 Tax=Runella zeae TaxID=94255 RepID=UPI0004066E20|nr:fibronectin type III domain-containing protein [Runella zeae]
MKNATLDFKRKYVSVYGGLMGIMLFMTASSYAQINAWQHYTNDTLQLLWTPLTADAWLRNHTYGYRIERAEIIKGQRPRFALLTPQPLKPLDKTNWKRISPESAAAYQAIYGSNGSNSTEGIGKNEANQQEMRHFMALLSAFKSPEVAYQMGIGFRETNLVRNKKYLYKIYAALPKNAKNDTAYISIDTSKPTVLKSPPVLKVDELEKTVVVHWPAKSYAQDFVMYHIERSDDGKVFRRITKTPLIHADRRAQESSYKDSLGINYRPYVYRLVGMTPFGVWKTGEFTTIAMGRDKTPPSQPFIESAKHLGGQRIEITWKQEPYDDDLSGFWVRRASHIDGQFKNLTVMPLPKTERRFVDDKADLNSTNHYIVYAVDTAGNERASFAAYASLQDSIAPVPPQKLTGKISPKGEVTIRWKKNDEKDLMGYYVYYANDPTHEFSQVTHQMLVEPEFRDTITLRSLTKKVYYRVVAADKHFNHSQFSEILELKRPDSIKPVVPLITHIDVKENEATIHWGASPSDDVVEYRLYRREQKKEATLMKSFTKNTLSIRQYKDVLQPHITYEYYLEVVDENGLVSDKSPVQAAKAIPSFYLTDSPQPSVTYIDKSKQTKITWSYKGKETYRMIIYRAQDKRAFKVIGIASQQEGLFMDKPPRIGTYQYMLKAIAEDGRETKFSNPVEIKL